jgi:hypothetical protein
MTRLLDTMLVCAVATILIVRTQLWLTNYPQLGGRGLHIAHLLWGGLLMLVALVILLGFVSPSAREVAAVVGGVGLGALHRRVGKVRHRRQQLLLQADRRDHLLLFHHLLSGHPGSGPAEGIHAAGVPRQRDRDTQGERAPRSRRLEAAARARIARTGRPVRSTRARASRHARADALPSDTGRARGNPGRTTDSGGVLRCRRSPLVRARDRRVLQRVGIGFTAADRRAGRLRHGRADSAEVFRVGHRITNSPLGAAQVDFIQWADLAASVVATGFVVAGLYWLGQSRRIAAFAMFERAVLVSIFFTQVFAFVYSQFAAVFGLFFDLLLFVAVRAILGRELEQEALRPRGDERMDRLTAPAGST